MALTQGYSKRKAVKIAAARIMPLGDWVQLDITDPATWLPLCSTLVRTVGEVRIR